MLYVRSIELKIQFCLFPGRIRNIYFPFDIESDTALSVATEMVAELDITDQDVTKIADMIDGEISKLVPDWRPGPGLEEICHFANPAFCYNCASNHTSTGSFMNFLSNNPAAKNLQFLQCSSCATHGRFEEITYQANSPRLNVSNHENDPASSSQINGFHHMEYWDRHESLECSSVCSGESHSLEENEKQYPEVSTEVAKEAGEIKSKVSSSTLLLKSLPVDHSSSMIHTPSSDLSDEFEQEIQQS